MRPPLRPFSTTGWSLFPSSKLPSILSSSIIGTPVGELTIATEGASDGLSVVTDTAGTRVWEEVVDGILVGTIDD